MIDWSRGLVPQGRTYKPIKFPAQTIKGGRLDGYPDPFSKHPFLDCTNRDLTMRTLSVTVEIFADPPINLCEYCPWDVVKYFFDPDQYWGKDRLFTGKCSWVEPPEQNAIHDAKVKEYLEQREKNKNVG